eukprot:m.58273 g.58273  ORF g.58273 m.58273 type:complete len:219 (-) comp12849_c1_seq1:273-929(-)
MYSHYHIVAQQRAMNRSHAHKQHSTSQTISYPDVDDAVDTATSSPVYTHNSIQFADKDEARSLLAAGCLKLKSSWRKDCEVGLYVNRDDVDDMTLPCDVSVTVRLLRKSTKYKVLDSLKNSLKENGCSSEDCQQLMEVLYSVVSTTDSDITLRVEQPSMSLDERQLSVIVANKKTKTLPVDALAKAVVATFVGENPLSSELKCTLEKTLKKCKPTKKQ